MASMEEAGDGAEAAWNVGLDLSGFKSQLRHYKFWVTLGKLFNFPRFISKIGIEIGTQRMIST